MQDRDELPTQGSSTYRDAVTERLDDELSHWQMRLDRLGLNILKDSRPDRSSLEQELERLRSDLAEAIHQWKLMNSASSADWRREREALTGLLKGMRRSLQALPAELWADRP